MSMTVAMIVSSFLVDVRKIEPTWTDAQVKAFNYLANASVYSYPCKKIGKNDFLVDRQIPKAKKRVTALFSSAEVDKIFIMNDYAAAKSAANAGLNLDAETCYQIALVNELVND